MKNMRGYISSRMLENDVPQYIQQIVIRDYCKRNDINFLLSATEYIMEGCTIMLNSVLHEDIDGVIFYSIYLLPESEKKRHQIYSHIGDKEFHFAAENIVLRTQADIDRVEDIFLLRSIITNKSAMRELEGWK